MFVNITEKPPWGSVIKAITITIITVKRGQSRKQSRWLK